MISNLHSHSNPTGGDRGRAVAGLEFSVAVLFPRCGFGLSRLSFPAALRGNAPAKAPLRDSSHWTLSQRGTRSLGPCFDEVVSLHPGADGSASRPYLGGFHLRQVVLHHAAA